MSAAEFVSSLVESLAWPAAAVALAVLFRPAIDRLLSRHVSRVKAGPFEVELARQRAEVSEELGLPDLQAVGVSSDDADELVALARRDPTAAVLEASARVEGVLRDLLTDHGETLPDHWGASALARRANEVGMINDVTREAAEGLAVLRRLASYGGEEVTAERAAEYLVLVEGVLYALRHAQGKAAATPPRAQAPALP